MGDIDPNNDPSVVRDDTPFPVPSLYFRVFDSEKDEPDAKYRRDVLKLYERWEKKYGRRWPDNGLNTDDLVWLYNEAYKDEEEGGEGGEAAAGEDGGAAGGGGGKKKKGGKARRQQRQLSGAEALKTYPREKQDYEGQFMTATEDLEADARAALPKDPKARAAAAARARADVDAGAWLTDEFESEAYEMGNMEALHGHYLWDKEGKPAIMPEGPPKEELGEGSEGWSDFYGSLRPRHVVSDDARDALWATDEFESDEDNTESEWEPEYVGAGLGLKQEDPMNWQYSLRHSNHPLAPFPGEALKWASYVYDDGTTYEGLTRDAVPHGMGVMVFGYGTGGGFHFRDVRTGDKYEGEFQAGYAHGLGQFTSVGQGELYVGEFFAGQRHGCGLKVDMQPFYFLVQRGVDPVQAYQRTYKRIMRDMEFRTWYRNTPLGGTGEGDSVLVTVRDEAGSPFDALVKNYAHEAKLKRWRDAAPEQRAVDKLADVLQRVNTGKHAWGSGYRGRGKATALNEVGGLGVASAGASEDSIELMVGRDEDGKLGPGWFDATDSELYPLDERTRTQVAVEALQDKIDESEDKEAVLGGDVLNPTTGLSLKDYLEGREAQHNELLARRFGVRADVDGADEQRTSFLQDEEVKAILKSGAKLGRGTEDLLLRSLRAHDAAWEEDDPYAPTSRASRENWADADTDTRFETESDVMELCDLAEVLGTIDEAEEVVARARMWRWKPYGEATLRFAQDGNGAPVELMQDPLHYPHGTKWMAPGPLGQCHPLPDDRNVRLEMARAAHNHAVVYNRYNFDWDPQPGSANWLINQRVRRGAELQGRMAMRLAGALDDAEAEAEEAAGGGGGGEEGGGGGGGGAQPAQLLAEAPVQQQQQPQQQPASQQQQPQQQPQQPPPPFASMSAAAGGLWLGGAAASTGLSQGVGRASKAVLRTLARAAARAPALPSGRPRLSRPARR